MNRIQVRQSIDTLGSFLSVCVGLMCKFPLVDVRHHVHFDVPLHVRLHVHLHVHVDVRVVVHLHVHVDVRVDVHLHVCVDVRVDVPLVCGCMFIACWLYSGYILDASLPHAGSKRSKQQR